MSYEIREYIDDIPRKVSVNLNPDQGITPFTSSYPITWTGYIGNEKVEIKQIGILAYNESDFEFVTFPEKYFYHKRDVIGFIDEYLKGKTK
jgi:hypothetical protein